MGEVASVRKVKSHECLARLEAGHHDGHICLRSRVWLYICILGLENLAQSVDGKLFNLVNNLATSVISRTRISFGIFVRADGTKSFQNLLAHIVFRRNQLYS